MSWQRLMTEVLHPYSLLPYPLLSLSSPLIWPCYSATSNCSLILLPALDVGQSRGGAAPGARGGARGGDASLTGARCLQRAALAVVATCVCGLFCFRKNGYNPDSSHEYAQVKVNVSCNSNENTTSNSALCFYGTFLLESL